MNEIHNLFMLTEVADAWLDCLIEIIPLLPLSVLQKEVSAIVQNFNFYFYQHSS